MVVCDIEFWEGKGDKLVKLLRVIYSQSQVEFGMGHEPFNGLIDSHWLVIVGLNW